MQDLKGFRQLLTERQREVGSVVCVGLDPLPEKLPTHLQMNRFPAKFKFIEWMEEIVDATAEFASMFKLQRAHYEALPEGEAILRTVIKHIEMQHSEIPVFLDCKRGDIGRTQERYRVAHFGLDKVYGVNFPPYMGKDCMEGLFDKENPERALVSLCYTSNPAARQMQDVLLQDGRAYWEFVAETVLSWADELGTTENAGLVMAAAYEKEKGSGVVYSEHLTRCREIVGDKLWFLIPGIGTQGGFVEETMSASFAGPGSVAINSSSDIIFASRGTDFKEAAAGKAEALHFLTRF